MEGEVVARVAAQVALAEAALGQEEVVLRREELQPAAQPGAVVDVGVGAAALVVELVVAPVVVYLHGFVSPLQ